MDLRVKLGRVIWVSGELPAGDAAEGGSAEDSERHPVHLHGSAFVATRNAPALLAL
jgi:hypothetical protein